MINLDDIPISNWGLQIQKEHDHPAIPEIRTKTITIPGMPGQWDFGSEIGSRNFNFPLGLIEYDKYEKQRKLNEFVAFLFDPYGRPREMKLSFEYEPDKYYLVKVANGFSPQRIFGFSFFELPLIANKPFKKFVVPTDEINLDSDIPLMSDITLDAEYSFDFNITNENTQGIFVYNEGTLTVRPTFVFTGSADYLAVSVSGGSSFVIAPFSNKAIEINGENYTVKQDGVSSLSLMTAGNFIELPHGKNQLTIRGTNLNANLKVKFNFQYM